MVRIKNMGEFFSILCTIFWSISVILFKMSGDNISSKILNAYKTAVASILFLITIIILGELHLYKDAKVIDIILLVISSFFGMAIGDTLFYKSLKTVGASAIAIIEASQPPFVILVSSIFFGEKLFLKDYFGAFLVCLAIILSASKQEGKVKASPEFIKGIFVGLLAMFLMAVSVVIIKKPFIVSYGILEQYPAMWTSSIRVFVTTLVLSPMCLTAKYRSSYVSLFNMKHKNSRFLLIGSILGGYVSLIFWIYGIKLIEKVSIAIILNQLSVVFIIIFAGIFLKEKITLKKTISMILAVTGCVIVIL